MPNDCLTTSRSLRSGCLLGFLLTFQIHVRLALSSSRNLFLFLEFIVFIIPPAIDRTRLPLLSSSTRRIIVFATGYSVFTDGCWFRRAPGGLAALALMSIGREEAFIAEKMDVHGTIASRAFDTLQSRNRSAPLSPGLRLNNSPAIVTSNTECTPSDIPRLPHLHQLHQTSISTTAPTPPWLACRGYTSIDCSSGHILSQNTLLACDATERTRILRAILEKRVLRGYPVLDSSG